MYFYKDILLKKKQLFKFKYTIFNLILINNAILFTKSMVDTVQEYVFLSFFFYKRLVFYPYGNKREKKNEI